ncbi:MAG: hypothetical protein ACRDK3_03180 [Actinomycetota bacterium]
MDRSRESATARGWSPGATRTATWRRLVLSVRLTADDIVCPSTTMKRSMTEGWNNTSGSSSRPTETPKAPRRATAHRSALARSALGGAVFVTTVRAKRATSSATATGR